MYGLVVSICGVLVLLLWIALMFAHVRLLIRRYEKESSLSESRAVKSAPFLPALPAYMRSMYYGYHLTAVWLMSDAFLRRSPNFSDLSGREDVLGFFSRAETHRIVMISVASCLWIVLVIIGDWMSGAELPR